MQVNAADMMNNTDAKELLRRIREGIATPEEIALLDSWYLNWKKDEPVGLTTSDFEEAERAMFEHLPKDRNYSPYRLWPRIVAVAAMILFISIGGYIAFQLNRVPAVADMEVNLISPGGNKAVLTLASGKQIVLSSTKNGALAKESGAYINKTSDGNIIYNSTAPPQVGASLAYNTVATPKGGQYHIILADGTGVWLNAASSIKYPAVFAGNERSVEITGEAYFEVAHNASRPFRVKSAGQTVTVLGTHFDVNAYADEPQVRTTLIEGSVKVTRDTTDQITAILKPGQQAVFDNHRFSITSANTQATTAWKDGKFMFRTEPLKNIMRQISRWYDVEIVYQDDLSDKAVWGTLTRYSQVTDVLKMIELTGAAHFKITGNKIIVTK